MIEFSYCSFRQKVVGVGEQMESLYQKTYWDRGIEAEGFVTDNTYIGQMNTQIVGNEWNMLVGANKDGDIA